MDREVNNVVIIDIVSAFGAVAGLPWLVEVTEVSASYLVSRLQASRRASAYWRGWRDYLSSTV